MELRRSKRLSSSMMSPASSPKKQRLVVSNVLKSNNQSINMPMSPPVTPTKVRIIDLTSDEKPLKSLSFNTPPTTPIKDKIKNEYTSTNTNKSNIFNENHDSTSLKIRGNVYSQAKALFQRGFHESTSKLPSSCLVGRHAESEQLNQFLMESIENNMCNSLYISGPPGTGKTAQVNVSFNYLSKSSKLTTNHEQYFTMKSSGKTFNIIKINCMTIAKPEYIFHEIYCSITNTSSMSYGKKKTFDDVFQLLSSEVSLDSIILLLDEMDSLITKDQQVLFQLFNCASNFKSDSLHTKLILIGISNALDLTDKFLPRLKSNGLNPSSLQFLPYSSDQIKSIITNKLKSLVESDQDQDQDKENFTIPSKSIPIMHPMAIQLCCKKAANVTGDLRNAFDICYKSIESMEISIKSTYSNVELLSLNFENAPKVHISHVANTCATSFGDNSLKKLTNLNLLQKAVLCCLFNYQIQNMSSNSTPNVNKFFDYYLKHATNSIDNLLGKLRKGEFLEIISALESTSVITLSSNNSFVIDLGNKLVKANVSYDDLIKGIGEVGVLKKILHYSEN